MVHGNDAHYEAQDQGNNDDPDPSQPLDEDDARKEQEKKESFVRKAREHVARGEEYEPGDMNVFFDENLMDRYN